MKKLLSMPLQDIYLDWVNNFISIESMASHYNIGHSTLVELISVASEIYNKTYKTKAPC